MTLASIAKQAERFARDNSPAILTAVGVVGTVTTALLTAKATFTAAEIIEQDRFARTLHEKIRPAETRDKLELVWKCYIPPVGTGIMTVAAIILVNRIGTRRTAAMAAAYSVAERGFEEYREKVVEKLGANKETALRDEIAQERISRNPVSDREVLITNGGDVLCFDTYTGRYFTSTMEQIKKAQNDINYQIIHHNYASLADFYLLVGIPAPIMAEEVGWNSDNLMDIKFSACLTEDDRPCMSISFQVSPVKGYHKFR